MIWHWISRNMAVLTLATSLVAYAYPPCFLIFRGGFLWLFAATMFAMGIVLHPEEVRETVLRPACIVQGVACQYTIMPLAGLAAATVAVQFGFTPQLALGFIIVGCAPGAMASNVITYLAGGAVAFSVAMTTLATMLSPLVTPALVQLLGGAFMDIPFWPMLQTILLTVALPLAAGMMLQPHLGRFTARAKQIAPGIAAIAIIVICAYAVAVNQARIASLAGGVLILVILLNGLGYAAGWAAARLFGFDRTYRITLAIEIGMQNAGLGVALALKHFSPETALPGALFAVWCILTAAGATRWLYRNQGQAEYPKVPDAA